MRDGALYGSAQIGDDPRTQRFLVMATLRREWPSMTRREFSRLSPEDVRLHLAYLEGLSEANQEKQNRK